MQPTSFWSYIKTDRKTRWNKYIRIHNIAIENMKKTIWFNPSNSSKSFGNNFWLKFPKISSAITESNEDANHVFFSFLPDEWVSQIVLQ